MFEALGRRLRAYAEKDGRGYPDWYLRYTPIVKRLRPALTSRPRILEIGANENGFSRFAGFPVIVADLSLESLKAARAAQDVIPIQADAGALPFRPDTFEACVCVDTFEHIPGMIRRQVVEEIVRVLGPEGAAVVAFPTGAGAEKAEEDVRKRYRGFSGSRLRWLEEHVEEGLPDAVEMRGFFEAAAGGTHRVAETKNVSVWLWRWMWLVLMCGWPGRANSVFQALLRALTPVFRHVNMGACYRKMIWLEPKQNGK